MKFSLNCRGRLVDLSTPAIMGIVNLTPDSFYDGGMIPDEKTVLKRVEFLLEKGCQILDIGGQSTRPKAQIISHSEEWIRIEWAIKAVMKNFPHAILSVDTFYSQIAQKAFDAGASIINDISGGTHDDKMFDVIGKLKLPYVLMHIPGSVETMHTTTDSTNIVLEVWNYFEEKIKILKAAGIEQIILDPGFGFGKTIEQNYSLLKNLNAFNNFNLPIMVGISRKSLINKVLHTTPADALNGTTVLNTIALLNNASILRVHDVIEAKEVITLFEKFRNVE